MWGVNDGRPVVLDDLFFFCEAHCLSGWRRSCFFFFWEVDDSNSLWRWRRRRKRRWRRSGTKGRKVERVLAEMEEVVGLREVLRAVDEGATRGVKDKKLFPDDLLSGVQLLVGGRGAAEDDWDCGVQEVGAVFSRKKVAGGAVGRLVVDCPEGRGWGVEKRKG